MKKLNRCFNLSALVVASFLTVACGQMNNRYSTKGATASASHATSLTPTPVQGEWVNCTSGVQTTYSFTGNGYWMEADTYESSGCTDSDPDVFGTPDEGTFQLTGAPAGTAESIVFIPYYASTDSDGSSQNATVAVLGQEIILTRNGVQLVLKSVTANGQIELEN